MTYPGVDVTMRLLSNAAKRAVADSRAEHPEDIAVAMSMAVESAGPVIMECWKLWGSFDNDVKLEVQ